MYDIINLRTYNTHVRITNVYISVYENYNKSKSMSI